MKIKIWIIIDPHKNYNSENIIRVFKPYLSSDIRQFFILRTLFFFSYKDFA